MQQRVAYDQTQLKISLETIAKLEIQKKVKEGEYELIWSYVLDYETSKNPYEDKKRAIFPWREIARENIKENENILSIAEELREKGIKSFDALHIACAEDAKCEFFITTDRKLLKTKREKIIIVDPIEFIRITEE